MTSSIRIDRDRVEIVGRLAISFQRTLRIPDDGQVYPLPPTLGTFPLHSVSDYPALSSHLGGSSEAVVFIPMVQREALWLSFEALAGLPVAVKVGVGEVNALTGTPWQEGLQSNPQDYLVCPLQPWLDGINSGDGEIRQFTAMPLGQGYTVEGQITGAEQVGGIQILIYSPLAGKIKPRPARPDLSDPTIMKWSAVAEPIQSMGLAPGGRISQKIYPDPYGLDVWDLSSVARLRVLIIDSRQYQQISGNPAPASPVSAKTYSEYGFPWFSLYDEAKEDIPPAEALAQLKSVSQVDQSRGLPAGQEELPPQINPGQIRKIDLDDGHDDEAFERR